MFQPRQALRRPRHRPHRPPLRHEATLDLSASYRVVFDTMLPDATQVADPFHVVKLANTTLEECRRRVQNETLGHRGRRDDPLWRVRRRLSIARGRLSADQHDRLAGLLRAGDPRQEVWFAWNADRKWSVRSTPTPTPNLPSSASQRSVPTSAIPRCRSRFDVSGAPSTHDPRFEVRWSFTAKNSSTSSVLDPERPVARVPGLIFAGGGFDRIEPTTINGVRAWRLIGSENPPISDSPRDGEGFKLRFGVLWQFSPNRTLIVGGAVDTDTLERFASSLTQVTAEQWAAALPGFTTECTLKEPHPCDELLPKPQP